MELNRSEVAVMSKEKCAYCTGSGIRVNGEGNEEACNCVLRGIFRACFRRFRECAAKDTKYSRISLERGSTLSRSGGWGRKEEEFVADFCLIAKRALDEEEYKIFRFHFLLGADYRLCCRKLQMDRGVFFHTIYKIQRKLGVAFRDTTPYPLFPLCDYFGGPQREHSAKVVEMQPEQPRRSPFKPVKRAA
jgi:hypothetical protein